MPSASGVGRAACRLRLAMARVRSAGPGMTSSILSAQNWSQVRDELVSGRLVEYLRRIGRPELIPHSAQDRSPDDRLDEWLARIPAAQSSAPELDVHPETLLVQAKMGGGITRLSLRITNVGFRLLAQHGADRAGPGTVGQAAGRARRPAVPDDRPDGDSC